MTRNGRHITKPVGLRGHILVFAPDDRPNLPAVQSVAIADVDERIKIIVGDNVPFLRLAVNRKHHEENFVAKQPVLKVAIKWDHRGVIQVRIQRPLLEINREQRELPGLEIIRLAPAGETQQLAKLPAPFVGVMLIGQQRIKNVVFAGINDQIPVIGKKRREGERFIIFPLFRIEKRAGRFGSLSGFQRQFKFIK